MRPSWSVLAALSAAAALSAGCTRGSYEKPLVPVKVQMVEYAARSNVSRFSANVLPREQVPVAFRVGEYVSTLMQLKGMDGRLRDIQEGDDIKQGDVLARLRESNYAAKVSQVQSQLAEAEAGLNAAQAQLAEAEVTRDQAKRDSDRAGRLFETQSITKPEFDGANTRLAVTQEKVQQAHAQITAIRAKIDQAKAGLEEARSALQDCSLKAPISGTVLKRMIEPGSLVGPGTAGFVLADTSSVKLVFGVPDVTVRSLRVGNPLTMTTESLPDEKLHGRISRMSPSADPKTRLFDVEATIANESGRLKAGMIASLQVGEESSGSPAPVVPLSAVVRSKKSPDSYAVYVLEGAGGSGIARLRDIKLGEVFGNSISIVSGLNAADQVIVAGATIVSDGERVRVMP